MVSTHCRCLVEERKTCDCDAVETMSFEWSTQPLSLSTILSRFSLPIFLRTATGQHGSTQPILLYASMRFSFAVGNALHARPVSKNGYESYRPIESELIAVPLKFPGNEKQKKKRFLFFESFSSGFFECVPPSRRGIFISNKTFFCFSLKFDQFEGNEPIVLPETNLSSIVQQFQDEQRSQAFYLLKPIRIFTLEKGNEDEYYRRWKIYDAHQVVVFEKIIEIEYTPTADDNLTDDDYEFTWWNCFGKKLLKRHEFVFECFNDRNEMSYFPLTSTNELFLLPVGQRGSTNMRKLQTIENLLEKFPLPLNLRLTQLPNCLAFADFSSYFQLRGFHSEDFAICASLDTSNISIVHPKTPLKFVVSVIPLLSDDDTMINSTLSRCESFLQNFHLEIRRLKILTRSKAKKNKSRSLSSESNGSNDGRKIRNHSAVRKIFR